VGLALELESNSKELVTYAEFPNPGPVFTSVFTDSKKVLRLRVSIPK